MTQSIIQTALQECTGKEWAYNPGSTAVPKPHFRAVLDTNEAPAFVEALKLADINLETRKKGEGLIGVITLPQAAMLTTEGCDQIRASLFPPEGAAPEAGPIDENFDIDTLPETPVAADIPGSGSGLADLLPMPSADELNTPNGP